jgi:hypothetical protein
MPYYNLKFLILFELKEYLICLNTLREVISISLERTVVWQLLVELLFFFRFWHVSTLTRFDKRKN